LEAEFLKGAEARNMVQLKGHRSVGKWIRENQANTWLRFSN
jgi:phosphoserine aminotransferase